MEPLITLAAQSTAATVWRFALAFFLVVVAIGLVYLLVKAGRALGSVDKMITDADREMVPLLQKAGTTMDEVNNELDKVNEITASVVGMTQKVDATARAVESAVSTPAKKAAAFTAGVQQSVSSFIHRVRTREGGMGQGGGQWTASEWHSGPEAGWPPTGSAESYGPDAGTTQPQAMETPDQQEQP